MDLSDLENKTIRVKEVVNSDYIVVEYDGEKYKIFSVGEYGKKSKLYLSEGDIN